MTRTKRQRLEDRKSGVISTPLKALNSGQRELLKALKNHEQVITLGPAGTGKTYLTTAYAADCLWLNKISKIILTRPNVTTSARLGYLPGTLEEKYMPWLAPMAEVIIERTNQGFFDTQLKNGNIQIIPFELMRGRTFKDCFVLLDEAQNVTIEEMMMFVTRIGDNATMVINGDINQSDIAGNSGLKLAINMVERYHISCPIIEFFSADIVRSGICKQWVEAFNKEGLYKDA